MNDDEPVDTYTVCMCVGEELPHNKRACEAIETRAVRDFLQETKEADARERRDWSRLRSRLLALMLSITFAGGVLLGLLIGAFQVPGPFVAPVVLVVSGLFWLLTLSRVSGR